MQKSKIPIKLFGFVEYFDYICDKNKTVWLLNPLKKRYL